MSTITEIVEEKMKIFDSYLEYSNMDKKQYQFDGVKWCLNNELNSVDLSTIGDKKYAPSKTFVKGGFITDEMGLGKTIMMIGLMLCNPVQRTLIVLPPILIDQWVNQIYRTTGNKVLVYHGTNKKKITHDQLITAPVVITTYGGITIAKNKLLSLKENPEHLTKLHTIPWSRIIFDEAHHLRNTTSRSKSVKLLNREICWLVSGTPIQNRQTDFNNLCSILKMPAKFYKNTKNLQFIRETFILKRTKKQVGIIIPEKYNEKQIVNWNNSEEKELSEELHSWLRCPNMPPMRSDKYLCGILYGDTGPLPIYMRSRQLCVLPNLMKNAIDRLESYCKNDPEQLEIINIDKYRKALEQNSKMDAAIKKILERKDNGNGKIIFCHFREEMDTIKQRLHDGGIEKIATFDGRVNNKMRNTILTMQNDVLILQIQTGCEGLNLQENYNEVYFISPHWNPAIEEQAVARCHRIGQKKEVFVFRFEMGNFTNDANTLEHYVDSVQIIKKKISEEILEPPPPTADE